MIKVLAFALCVASASPALAQERDGNWWNTLGAPQKSLIMVGFMEGMELGKSFSIWEGVKKSSAEPWVWKGTESYVNYFNKFVAKISYGQMTEGLDVFYKDFRNRSIVLPDALWIVLNQISGTPQAEVDSM